MRTGERTWHSKTPWTHFKMCTKSWNHTTVTSFENKKKRILQGHPENGIHPLPTEEHSHLGTGRKLCATSNTFHFALGIKMGFPHITSLFLCKSALTTPKTHKHVPTHIDYIKAQHTHTRLNTHASLPPYLFTHRSSIKKTVLPARLLYQNPAPVHLTDFPTMRHWLRMPDKSLYCCLC